MSKSAEAFLTRVERALADAIGSSVRIEGRADVGGGCIHDTEVLRTTAGSFFLKSSERGAPSMFAAEAAGLLAMRASGTPLVIPEPIAWFDSCSTSDGRSFLVLEHLEAGPRSKDFEARLGEGLAEMHRATAWAFGFEGDGYCGATPQPNAWSKTWAEFYAERRIRHQIELAAPKKLFSAEDRRACERLIDKLPELLAGTEEPPALIHGDLWSGNLHADPSGAPSILDPAAYYGHREAEVGMMTLFGGFGPRVFDAYERAWPLPAGWRERNALYELYHVLNHANLFGGGYARQAIGIVRRYA